MKKELLENYFMLSREQIESHIDRLIAKSRQEALDDVRFKLGLFITGGNTLEEVITKFQKWLEDELNKTLEDGGEK